jgi:hypothetical protein
VKRTCLLITVFAINLIFLPFVFGGELRLVDSESAMKKQLLSFIPIGSNVDAGKSFLEQNGFLCSWYKQQRFAGYEGKMDYIYCNYQSRDFPVNKSWQIALIPEGNKTVKDIAVSFGFVGP